MIATATTTLDTECEKRDLKSINGQLPTDVSREELEEAIWQLEEEGRDELNADEAEIINRVLSFLICHHSALTLVSSTTTKPAEKVI
jgi:hypothetical protein